ncbi:MAG: NAD+ synthase, partial [Thermoplasmata archaeon]|nr:NAD+ synthase [Thermoplasmata archaeon]NIS14022.1 NAD+ synthase [Thermoplasmata archaeon]NIS21854.1 NAD+ synthase [Thermoplasmata archaeon]NIT79459.1 NAD+ synthase [Thermoplasmata archaeon]NIU50889.1 NAD+ synthase [Thermoplasmata archaeon]
MRISLAQINPVVGDVAGNLERMVSTVEECHVYDPDLVVFPELCLTGYPPRDLLERDWFIDRVERAVEEFTKFSKDFGRMAMIFGAPQRTGMTTGRGLYNSALMVQNGKLLHVQHKSLLPNYDVFDEARYFDVARSIEPVLFMGESLGISVCEDAWTDPVLWP